MTTQTNPQERPTPWLRRMPRHTKAYNAAQPTLEAHASLTSSPELQRLAGCHHGAQRHKVRNAAKVKPSELRSRTTLQLQTMHQPQQCQFRSAHPPLLLSDPQRLSWSHPTRRAHLNAPRASRLRPLARRGLLHWLLKTHAQQLAYGLPTPPGAAKERGAGPAPERSKAPLAKLGSHNAMFGSAASSSPTVAANEAFAASKEGSSALKEREAHASCSPTLAKNHLSPASLLDALDPQSSTVRPDAAENTFKDFTPNTPCPRYMPRDG